MTLRYRRLVLFTLSFVAGVLLAQYSPFFSLAALLPAVLYTVKFRGKTALFLALVLIFGSFYADFSDRHHRARAEVLAGKEQILSGRIVSLPEEKPYGQSFYLDTGSQKLFVMAREKTAGYGDEVTFTATPYQPEGRRFFGDFDYARYLKSKGVYLCAYTTGLDITRRADGRAAWWDVAFLRERLLDAADTLWSGEERMFARAILLGNSDLSSEEFRDKLADSSLSHVIAVSGLHISLMALVIQTVFRALTRKRRFIPLLTIPFLWFFVFLTGASPSAVRAGMMTSLALVAAFFGEYYDGFTAMAFSALCLLVYNPFLIYSLSFELSYAAVAGILLFAGPLKSCFKGFPWAYLTDTLCVTLSAQIFTVPILAVTFGSMPLFSVFANLLAIPLIPFIMLTGYLTLAVSAIPAVAQVGAWITGKLIDVCLVIADIASKIPFGHISVNPTPSFFVLCAAWITFLCLFLFLRRRKVTLISGAAVLLILIGAILFPRLFPPCAVVIPETEEGTAILAVNGQDTVLILDNPDETYVEHTLLPVLRKNAVSSLDVLVMTEYNKEGAEVLKSRLPIKRFLFEDGFVPLDGMSVERKDGAVFLSHPASGLLYAANLNKTKAKALSKAYPETDVIVTDNRKTSAAGCEILCETLHPKAVLVANRRSLSKAFEKSGTPLGDCGIYTIKPGDIAP